MKVVTRVLDKLSGCIQIDKKFIEDIPEVESIRELTKEETLVLYKNIKSIRDQLHQHTYRQKHRDEYGLERWHQLIAVEFVLRLVRDYITATSIEAAVSKHQRETNDE